MMNYANVKERHIDKKNLLILGAGQYGFLVREMADCYVRLRREPQCPCNARLTIKLKELIPF